MTALDCLTKRDAWWPLLRFKLPGSSPWTLWENNSAVSSRTPVAGTAFSITSRLRKEGDSLIGGLFLQSAGHS
jgi:hypothetical protein